MINFYKKYLKYKTKYNNLKYGGNPGDGSRIKEIPQLCFGTGQEGFDIYLPEALKAGYRHIDGADRYEFNLMKYTSEKGITYFGVIKEIIKIIPRNELWITWKTTDLSRQNIQSIIEKLDCEYIDLLLHHDHCIIPSQELVTLCLIRYFGVSNCEDLTYLEGKNIYATQIQARPPKGNLRPVGYDADKEFIENGFRDPPSPNFDKFVNSCNSLDVRVMLYGSTSSLLQRGAQGFFRGDNIHLVNKYYLQKYIKGKKNILIVSSQSGLTIIPNIENFNKIMSGEDLLTSEEMKVIELELEKYPLIHMYYGR
jgi:hypothetical protein